MENEIITFQKVLFLQTRYIRKNERYSKIKIIVMTGLSEKDDKVLEIREAGVDGVIFKQDLDDQLMPVLKQVFRKTS